MTAVFPDVDILRDEVPDGKQILLVVVAHFQFFRTVARRPHHNIHAVVHGLLHDGPINGCEEGFQ